MLVLERLVMRAQIRQYSVVTMKVLLYEKIAAKRAVLNVIQANVLANS